jgi:SAM-dependent methyltransferase
MTPRAELETQVRDLTKAVRALEAEVRELRMCGTRNRLDGWGPRFAAIYDDFTDEFRGSVAEVTAKLEGYLPDVRRVAHTHGVVDLGSGRGEWLTLLRDAGVPSRGVDPHPRFVADGRGRGLDVEEGDAVGYLQQLPPNSIDMVTAFHLIEHLPVEELLELLEAAYNALRPGGCLLLETPNPANLIMGACDFYNDPTHLSPLPSALTKFLVSRHGFDDIEVRPLHPNVSPLPQARGDGEYAQLRDLVSTALFGPQDYAVLGYKPTNTV